MNNTVTAFVSVEVFNAAVAEVKAASVAYYDSDVLLMSDAEFDVLLARVELSVGLNPDWDDAGVLSLVAAGSSAGGDVKHVTPMLSLAKTSVLDGLKSFVDGLGGSGFVTEVKLDGMAVSVSFVDGELISAVTRGDGFTGEDITANVSLVNGLPVALGVPFTGTIRGEIFMTVDDFAVSNRYRVADGGAPFANPRNATAGSLRKVGSRSQMSFAAYDLVDSPAATHVDSMWSLTEMGFQTALGLLTVDAQGNPADVIDAIGGLRDSLSFPIDGAVVKLNNLADRNKAGSRSNSPKWALAWKYAAKETTSVLLAVNVAVGRTGRVSYTAVIEPVDIDGVTVTAASLHNPDFIALHKLGIGSRVLVTRANDVIPRVVSLPDSNNDIPVWTPPSTCPDCGDELNKTEVNWRCLSPECSIVGLVTYFCSRDAMDIEGVGTVVAEALVVNGNVTNVADIYALTVRQLTDLPLGEGRLLGEKNAVKIHANIENSKTQPLNRVITALGVRKTGRTMGRRLAAHYGSMANLLNANVQSLTNVEGIATDKAVHIRAGLDANVNVIAALAAAGVNMGSEVNENDGGSGKPLTGQTFVISGSVPGYTRTQAQERIEALGGTASSSVSAATTALITSETGTSKALKAAKLGVKVIDPVEFAGLLS
jgi:DNA ligase (NAD+)